MDVTRGRRILVTGASSGIGNHIAGYLSARGHTVYATARKARDLAELEKIRNVVPVTLDVRDPLQVREAFELVVREGGGLYGLVNNAGVGGLGMLSTWSDEDLADIFNVNVFGVHRVTNAFMGLLIQSGGRVVNIGSQGGTITSRYYGPYTMTKHALEAYTACLDLELRPYGVRAAIVQPGGIVSRVGDNAVAGTRARFQRAQAPFKEEAEQVLASFDEPPISGDDEKESETNRKPSSPEIVSVAVYDALFSETPKPRYLVGTRWEGDRVLNTLIGKLLDENDNPRHGYSRDELVAMLDRHISGRARGRD